MKHIECPNEYVPAGVDISLFLAGGITGTQEWQKEMIAKLSGSDLTLLNPRRAVYDTKIAGIEQEQIQWEHAHLLRADAILFWFTPETLCPITLYELGAWNFRPKKLFIGCDPGYQRKSDVAIQTKLERADQVIVDSLDGLAQQVLEWEAKKKENPFVRTPDQPEGRRS